MTRDCEHGRQVGKCADCDVALLEEALARNEDLIVQQGDALQEIVIAIRGEPDQDTRWSTHDAVDLVRQQLKDDRWLLQRCLNLIRAMPVKHPEQGFEREVLVSELDKRLT
jgi:hypothetical protein